MMRRNQRKQYIANIVTVLVLSLFLLACSKDIACDDSPEQKVLQENHVKIRKGYHYTPGQDSLSDLQSIELFDENGRLLMFRHYMMGQVNRKKSYEYDDQGRQIKVMDSISGHYRVFEYNNSCNAIKSTQYASNNVVLSSVGYKDSAEYRIFNYYDGNGDLQKTSVNKIDQYGNPITFEEYKFDYNYDENGLLLQETKKQNGRTTVTNIIRDSNGLMTKRIFNFENGRNGGYYYTYEYFE